MHANYANSKKLVLGKIHLQHLSFYVQRYWHQLHTTIFLLQLFEVSTQNLQIRNLYSIPQN